MATRKKEPQTLQARFGFADDDLKTSLHDDILVWLDENIDDVVDGLFRSPRLSQWDPKKLSCLLTKIQAHRATSATPEWVPENFDQLIPPCESRRTRNAVWERPITTQNGYRGNIYTVGFVDMTVDVDHEPVLNLNGTDDHGRITGPISWGWYYRNHGIYAFEAKAFIPSLGELIRQITYYRTYEPDWAYVVVSPDDRWIKQLKSQRIGFVLYPGTEKNP